MNYIVGLILIALGIAFHTPLNVVVPGSPLVINLGESLAMIGFLLVLFPVVQTFYTQPLSDAIQDRNTELTNTFTEVETLRSDMQKLKADYESRLAATEADAREKINSQIREAQVLRQTLMAEAAAKSDDLVRKANEEIAQEKAKVLAELRTHVSDLAIAAAEKVVGETMDSEKNRSIVDNFLNQIEAVK